MSKHSSNLAALLGELRHHPAFPELVAAVECPRLPRFKVSQADEAAKAHATWVYQSGRRDQHDYWLALLTGQAKETNE
jgi:hypothetical protein